jgi:hypothetical protein
VKTNGVMLAQVTPRSGMLSGMSSVVRLEAWNWEDAVYKADDGIHLNWPRLVTGNDEKAKKQLQQRASALLELNRFFDAALAYGKASYTFERNLKYEAMQGLFDGSKTLYIHANQVKQITEAVYFVRQYKLGKVVLVGGYDAWRVPELLNDNHISVVLRRVHSLPMREDDPIDLPFRLPALLHEAKVPFCLDNAGGMEAMQTRNLPFYAGTAVAYGLPYEEAVRAITLQAASILNIDKEVGSIEEGKDATIIVSKGDALDMRTNDIVLAWIEGKPVELTNHQQQLYERYRNKYNKKKQAE